MTKTRTWRGLHSNVDLTNQKKIILFFPKKKKMKEKRLRCYSLLISNTSSFEGLVKIE